MCCATNAADAHYCTSCGASLDGLAPAAPAAEWAAAPQSVAAASPPRAATSVDPVPPPVSPRAPGFKLKNPVSLIAAVVAIVGSALAWFDTPGGAVDAFDVAAPFLADHRTTASDTVTVGLLVVILGGAAGAICLLPVFGARMAALRGLGAALVAIAGAFAFQTVQTAGDIGVSFGDISGIGLFVTGIGGIGLLSGR